MITNLALAADMNRRLGPYAALADVPSASSWAAREDLVGLSPANPYLVTDAELLGVTVPLTNLYLDLVEYRAVTTILANLNNDNLRQIGVSEDVKDVYASWVRRARTLRADLTEKYGFGTRALQVGVVDLGFTATFDTRDVCPGG